jgi:iron only hydrogenase large subunit-like protein
MIKIQSELCDGKMRCLRICPTQAIRVRHGKATIIEERCVDCGRCLEVCPQQAIVPQTDAFAELQKMDYRLAVPSPTLFGQFSREFSPEDILDALTQIGFHEVADITAACEMVSWAIREYIHQYRGPRPLISSFCPAIVKLIQLRYPSLIDQLIPIKRPEVVAVELLKRKMEKSGDPRKAAFKAVYLTPCPTMTPALSGSEPSLLDGAIAIRDLYNPMSDFLSHQNPSVSRRPAFIGRGIRWARLGGTGIKLRDELWITAAGINESIMVLEDIESGKLQNTDYVETWSCRGGCIRGPLTVENYYLAFHKIISNERRHVESQIKDSEEIKKLFEEGFFFRKERIRPRSGNTGECNLIDALDRRKIKEEALRKLPHLDCGICGAPDCRSLAEDISLGRSELSDCIFFYSPDKFEELLKRLGIPNEKSS